MSGRGRKGRVLTRGESSARGASRGARRGAARAESSQVPIFYEPPFTVLDHERSLFNSLVARGVYEPRYIKFDWWKLQAEGDEEDRMLPDPCAVNFLRRLEQLGLDTWAKMVNVDSVGYRALMLEFFTTCKVLDDDSIENRFRDVEYKTTKEELRRIFKFFKPATRDLPVRLPEEALEVDRDYWKTLAGYKPREGARLKSTKIVRHSDLLAYKFLCQSFLGKEDVTRVYTKELKAMWIAFEGGHVDLLPLFFATIENVQIVSTSKKAKLIHGAFITLLARFHKVPAYADDTEYASKEIDMESRIFRGVTYHIPSFIPRQQNQIIPDDRLVGEYEDSDEEPPAPDPRDQPPAPEVPWTMTREHFEQLMANDNMMLANQMNLSMRLAGIEDVVYEMREDLAYMRWGPPQPENWQEPEHQGEGGDVAPEGVGEDLTQQPADDVAHDDMDHDGGSS